MNKEYVDINGNIVLEDENGKKKPIEYRDNLDEILIQENVVEAMELERQQLSEEIKNIEKNIKIERKHLLSPLGSAMLAIPIAVIILSCFGIWNLEPFSNILMNTMFGPITGSTVVITGMGAFGTFVGGLLSLVNYIGYKELLKRENAIKTTIEYLNGALEKAKEDLVEMKKQKTGENKQKGFRIVKINDRQAIRELCDHMNLYYDCGYEGRKYYKYYKKHDKLPKELVKTYNEAGQQAIIEYLEEKGPSLVKKRLS